MTASSLEADRARLRRLLAVVAVAVLPWLIAPGYTQPDTKLDLTVSPWRYLGRSLDAWNSHAGLGELQNQAYGYLFPMGPVFGVCHGLGMPGWAAQRVWWMILLVTAFTGMERLVRRLGVAGPGVAVLAGAAYALSPRVLTVLSEISIEAWPLALTPWLVLAAHGLTDSTADRRRLLRAAAGGGLLAVCLGGVNATASAVVLVVPFCYLVTHPVGRRRIVRWWLPGVILGALWWLLPLVVLGRYAYPFLDFIETARITTAVTSVPNVLRGASDWIAYILDRSDHPTWQAGWVIAQSITAIVATCAVAAAGAWGLLRRRRDHVVSFALTSLLAGTLFMVIGHAGVIGSPISTQVQALLDGPLAALRNVHKADPLIRLPLVLGLAALAQRLVAAPRLRVRLAAGALAVLVGASLTPLWQGREADPGGYRAIPQTWTTAAHDVDAAAAVHGGATLLLPNARTATYTWGNPTDEPLSALATSPVVTRASAPLGIPGSTRILDVADTLAASGEPQPALAAGLARMGIARIVVRRDLASSVGAQPWKLVEQTLRSSPGFHLAQTIGSGGGTLTLWDVTTVGGGAQTYDLDSTVSVAGGPEAIFDLLAAGVVTHLQAVDLLTGPASASAQVITDSLPWQAYNNGVPNDVANGPTLTRGSTEPTRIGALGLPPSGDPATQPARVLTGMASLRVSSSGADPFAAAYIGAGSGPAAVFDGDPSTSWLTGDHESTARLSLTLKPTVRVSSVRVQLAHGRGVDLPQSVDVQVGGVRRTVQVGARTSLTVRVPPTSAGAIVVSLHASAGVSDPVMGLSGLAVPGAHLGDVIGIPQRVDPVSQSILLHRDPRQRSQDPRQGDDGPVLRRQLTFTRSGTFGAQVWLRPAWGTALDATLDAPWVVSGSSVVDQDPSNRPGATFDGNPKTHWLVPASDQSPTLTVTLPEPTVVRGVSVSGGDPLSGLRVAAGGRSTAVGPHGGHIRAVTTRKVTISLQPSTSTGTWRAPEIRILGAPHPFSPTVVLGCGRVGGIKVDGGGDTPLRLQTTRAALLSGALVEPDLCPGPQVLTVPGGTHEIDFVPGSGLQTELAYLRSSRVAAEPAPRSTAVRSSSPSRRVIQVGPGAPAVVALDEGFNAGWQATSSDGRDLAATEVDGWRQGFTVPGTTAQTVTLTFAPTRDHRLGLLAGLVAAILLLFAYGYALAGRRKTIGAVEPKRSTRAITVSPAWRLVGGVVLTVAVGWLASGWAGALVGIAVHLIPRRRLAPVAAAALVIAGVALAGFGVVAAQSGGAIAGQLLGTITLTALARGLVVGDAPDQATVAPAASPMPTRPEC
ncbi:alpha-(1-_3)-arabinofuranosyltransferase domain-containing protein [Leekyejoonella antrihumi]|uniref:DUF3367 domain-containing protein n=1 Tax=Leekyejoonella antrihumi TaxID=1660198 RepID=A0A563E4F7_9MICO|nr:alpha-(1->3)-arabinofuranosyltransferase family protein [Leekyejoonella antrihumi]TWP37133.1 DUF3367 domain-containing protein [Leekyejoonella antrihumi]